MNQNIMGVPGSVQVQMSAQAPQQQMMRQGLVQSLTNHFRQQQVPMGWQAGMSPHERAGVVAEL